MKKLYRIHAKDNAMNTYCRIFADRLDEGNMLVIFYLQDQLVATMYKDEASYDA